MADLIGIIVSMDSKKLSFLKLDWAYKISKALTCLNVNSMRYLVARDSGGAVKLVAKVSSVSVFSGEQDVPWCLNFSEIHEVSSLDIPLGDPADGIGFINQSFERAIEAACRTATKHTCPNPLPPHLSIEEAVTALHRRYDVPEKNIKISLHN